MKYVIAGNSDQARHWIFHDMNRRATLGEHVFTNEYYILQRVDSLRGQRDPSGIFIGTWKQRKDLCDVLSVLLASMSDWNPSRDVVKNLLVDFLKKEKELYDSTS
jgi:hypothetical protein